MNYSQQTKTKSIYEIDIDDEIIYCEDVSLLRGKVVMKKEQVGVFYVKVEKDNKSDYSGYFAGKMLMEIKND
jgi:hypothetical protein